MKKNYVIALVALLATMTMHAQNEVQPYFTVDELPDLIKCLPAPPAFDSPEFANDMMRFAWGKQQRLNPERAELTGEGSYPSGHTMRGWTAALLLAEVNPAAADTIFARGWMYGESRVIVGAHWQSDVDASRVAASIGYSALHGSAEFREQMSKAQAEYLEKTGQASRLTEVMQPATITDGQAYRLDGIQTSDDTRGIVIQDGRKILRN